jgi:hypothetical protein
MATAAAAAAASAAAAATLVLQVEAVEGREHVALCHEEHSCLLTSTMDGR